jgi:hypothetical protein
LREQPRMSLTLMRATRYVDRELEP